MSPAVKPFDAVENRGRVVERPERVEAHVKAPFKQFPAYAVGKAAAQTHNPVTAGNRDSAFRKFNGCRKFHAQFS